jgi:hypothetical protein
MTEYTTSEVEIERLMCYSMMMPHRYKTILDIRKHITDDESLINLICPTFENENETKLTDMVYISQRMRLELENMEIYIEIINTDCEFGEGMDSLLHIKEKH